MNRNFLKIMLLLAFIFNLSLFLNIHLNQMPKYDDIYYYKLVDGIDKLGLPLVYRGEETGYQYGGGIIGDYINGLAHPPLGAYILYLFYLFLGKSIFSLRFVGYLNVLITILVLTIISKQIYSAKKNKYLFYLIPILYLTSHLVVQKSTYQSMDTLFYPALLGIFIFLILKYEDYKFNFLIFGLMLGILLLIKYTTVPILILSLFLYYVLRTKYFQAFHVTFWTSIMGVGLFLIAMWLFSQYSIDTFAETLNYTFARIATPLSFKIIVKHILTALAYDSFWVSPYIMVLFASSFLYRLIAYFKTRTAEKIDLIFIFVILGWLAYSIKAPDIYYKFPLFGLILLLIFYPFGFKFKFKKNHLAVYLLSSVLFFSLPDPFLMLPKLLPYNIDSIYYLILLSLYFSPLMFILSIKRKYRFSALLVISVIFFVSINLSQSIVDYSTVNLYGERGYDELIDYMKNIYKKDALIVVRDDAGFLIGGKYYRDDDFFVNNYCRVNNSLVYRLPSSCGSIIGPYNTNHLGKLENVSYFIYSSFLNEHMGGLNPEVKDYLDEKFILKKEFGHFKIYVRDVIN
ncbi:glycosyltransferase family 39 protein [Candidatus Woesearchaeota archaeon]|nr:glycosyltransferase family 39 protein [Candidatus Woesearchaeota archaeon]